MSKLTNVLGTVYNQGNVLYTSDGTTLIAPVGNKVTVYDLKHSKSRTLCFNSSHNYKSLALSPNGRLLVAVNEIGLTHCISLATNSLLHCMKLSDGSVLKFSPNGSYLAVGEPKMVKVYRAPSDSSVGVAPLDLERVFPNVPGNVASLDWSWDSVLLVAASSESPMISVFSMLKFSNFRNSCFTGHKLGIVGVFFEAMEYNLITVCKGGIIARWICSDEPEEWERDTESLRLNQEKTDWISKGDDESSAAQKSKKIKVDKDTEDTKKQLSRFNLVPVDWRQHEQQKDNSKRSGNLKLKSVDLNQRRTLAVLGFESGALSLIELPSGSLIQEISIMQQEITTLTFSPEGDWIAIGSSHGGLLVVWQQGHMDTIQCLDFSTDGRWIVTGAHDGKVKLWETQNGFACHTFSEHTSVVTGILFMQNNKAVVSSSLDGTVRAFDTMRYRNFRTFLASRGGAQFSCVAIDSSNTYLASGSIDEFQVFVWHVQSGRLLMEISGHTGPVAAVCFSPKRGSSMLASISWDKTLRIVDCLESDADAQVIPVECEATALAFRPDGNELVVATLNGNLSFINPDDQQVVGTVNGRFHMASTQIKGAARTVGKGFEDSAFQTISYSADGNLVLAGGKSPYICIYDAVHQVIVHKEEITRNRSLNQQPGDWTTKHQTEFGVIDMIQTRDHDEKLPGTTRRTPKADVVSHPDIIQTYATKFSPGGRMWVAATTEGVLLYTTDSAVSFFSPIDGSRQITPQAIDEALRDELYDAALFIALKLNIPATTTMVLEKIPVSFHSAIVSSMTTPLLKLCLQHLASVLNETSHVMFHMMLMRKLLQVHLKLLEDDREFMRPIISNVQKAANRRLKEPADVSDSNRYLTEVHQVLQMRGKSESPVRQRKLRKRVAAESRAENESDESDAVDHSDQSNDENEDTEVELNNEVSSDSEFEMLLESRS
ncbi:Periodic tryptophan protein 2 [Orchesella cincta]|uniref:Periodic tryptophan protein 2 n=1 Tax=Orchesella cincta TaxID=48709 RepID=A0A1D2MWD3_ORCCI|nr:Periodic tryptophan protein 2 [Orchesella cincta]